MFLFSIRSFGRFDLVDNEGDRPQILMVVDDSGRRGDSFHCTQAERKT
jgi:hypothetical protein